jgi:hypothetical protein
VFTFSFSGRDGIGICHIIIPAFLVLEKNGGVGKKNKNNNRMASN